MTLDHAPSQKIGSCRKSDITGFSFHPVKNITTGEGGVLTTNSLEIYKDLLRLRSHGIIKGQDTCTLLDEAYTDGELNPWFYEMQQLGYNYRITDLQCSLGISQLARINQFHSRRVEIGKKYDLAFSSLENINPHQIETREVSGNHLYVCEVNLKALKITKRNLFEKFKAKGILLHVHYIPVVLQPYYQGVVGTNPSDYPNAMNYYRHAITLPFFHSMTDEQVEFVIKNVKELIG